MFIFYDCYGNKSNTYNLWESKGGDSGLYFQLRVVYGVHHIKKISLLFRKQNRATWSSEVSVSLFYKMECILQMKAGSSSCDGDVAFGHIHAD